MHHINKNDNTPIGSDDMIKIINEITINKKNIQFTFNTNNLKVMIWRLVIIGLVGLGSLLSLFSF